MAFEKKESLQTLEADGQDSAKGESKAGQGSGPKGPPPQFPKPKSQSTSPFGKSLLATAGAGLQGENSAGMGAEGSDPAIIGTQGFALVQRGLQMMNLAFPDNPGLTAVLADLMSRLQTIIPQLVAGNSNMAGGMFPQQQPQMGMPGGGMPGMGGAPGGPPGGAPPGPPSMQGAPMAPSGAGPIAPPIPAMR